MKKFIVISALAIAAASSANAAEYYIGEPFVQNGLIIVPNYLTGIKMEPMPRGMAMDDNAIHLEVDVHAAKGEPHGFPEGAWIPYLNISYTLIKIGSDFKESGELLPMTANDGPHYANNIDMAGPGQYHLTYRIEPPSKNGFIRHIDQASGVPAWWEPFSIDWTFNYPGKVKND